MKKHQAVPYKKDVCSAGSQLPSRCRLPDFLASAHGYLFEKIISADRQNLCYEGMLTLDERADAMCTPVTLCDLEVISIRPCGRSCSCGGLKLKIQLLCQVIDARGIPYRCRAAIEVEICEKAPRCDEAHQIRRGAQIRLLHARSCSSCSFFVSLEICLLTFVCADACIVPPKKCCENHTPLPLYPPPIKMSAKRKRGC